MTLYALLNFRVRRRPNCLDPFDVPVAVAFEGIDDADDMRYQGEVESDFATLREAIAERTSDEATAICRAIKKMANDGYDTDRHGWTFTGDHNVTRELTAEEFAEYDGLRLHFRIGSLILA